MFSRSLFAILVFGVSFGALAQSLPRQGPMPQARPTEWIDAQNAAAQPAPAPAAPAASAPAGGGGKGYTIRDCEDEAKIAMQACTTTNMSAGMNPQQQQQAAGLMQQAQQGNQNVNQLQQAQAQQCQNQADLSKILGALSGLKAGACEKTILDCNSVCSQVEKTAQNESDRSRARSINGRCSSLQGQAGMALAQALAMMMSAMQNQKCADALRNTANASPTPADACKDPNTAKYNPNCICNPAMPGADPKNPICGTNQVGKGSMANPSSGYAGGTTPREFTSDTPGDGTPYVPVEGAAKNEKGGAETPQNGGGGPQSLGAGGARGGVGGGGEGGGPSGIEKPITGASSGGGGAGAGGMAGGGGGGGGNAGGPPAEREGFLSKFDLNKFLPKAQYKNRGLAGMSVTAKDGITGPMGPTIWEKVSNQYQNQKTRLLNDR